MRTAAVRPRAPASRSTRASAWRQRLARVGLALGLAASGAVQAAGVTPTLSIGDVSLVEGQSGTQLFHFTVSLDDLAGAAGVQFDFATADGTAMAGSDYASLSGAMAFAPGTDTLTLAITVFGDTSLEPDESFFVNLSNVVGANLLDAQGLGLILNDDAASPAPVPEPATGLLALAALTAAMGATSARRRQPR